MQACLHRKAPGSDLQCVSGGLCGAQLERTGPRRQDQVCFVHSFIIQDLFRAHCSHNTQCGSAFTRYSLLAAQVAFVHSPRVSHQHVYVWWGLGKYSNLKPGITVTRAKKNCSLLLWIQLTSMPMLVPLTLLMNLKVNPTKFWHVVPLLAQHAHPGPPLAP